MKCLISHWSLPRENEDWCPVETALAKAKAAGLDGVEFAISETGLLSLTTDRATCERYRAAGERAGLPIETVASGTGWGVPVTSDDPAVRKRAVDLLRQSLERASWLGAKAMLMVPGWVNIAWVKETVPVRYDLALTRAGEAVKALAGDAERLNVDLCVENVWNALMYSPVEFAQFIDKVGSPRVGAYFDVGNVLGYHQYPPHWVAILGPRIKRVHIKDFKVSVGNIGGFCDLLEGDVPWKATMAALREIGYDKTIVAELATADDAKLKEIRAAMAKIVAM